MGNSQGLIPVLRASALVLTGVFNLPSAVNHHCHEVSRVSKILSRSEKGKIRPE